MAEANRTALTRRAEKVTACLSSAVIAPLTLGQCPAKIITAAHTAPTMFAMGAMLGPLAAQLKMPRPDGYNWPSKGAVMSTDHQVKLTRRNLMLLAGVGVTSSPTAAAVEAEPLQETSDELLRVLRMELVLNANKHWANTDTRFKMEFGTTFALRPFRDWDFYFTRGLARWSPNKDQAFAAVEVPEGFVTDLASIPQVAWSFGVRPEGPYTYAAVVHDYLYWTQTRARDEADEIFLIAMTDSKVAPVLRNRIYDAVRLFGGFAWTKNAEFRRTGERRVLGKFPEDFTIPWAEWKTQPGVFVD